MMNWQQMSKDQKQKVVLGGLLGVFALVALFQFGIMRLVRARDEMTQKRVELADNIEKAQQAIRNEVMIDKQVRELRASMETTFSTMIPPADNALAWASRVVNEQTKALGLEVTSIIELDQGAVGWDQPDLVKRAFKPYAVKVDVSCSFDKVRKLVRALQQSNEHLAITGIAILADTRNVEYPSTVLIIEWPSWRDAKRGANPFASTAGEKKI